MQIWPYHPLSKSTVVFCCLVWPTSPNMAIVGFCNGPHLFPKLISWDSLSPMRWWNGRHEWFIYHLWISSIEVMSRYIVCAHSLICVQLFATPWTISHQAPLSMGFPRQEYWNGLPFPTRGNLPGPGIEPIYLASPALAGIFLTISANWEAPNTQ